MLFRPNQNPRPIFPREFSADFVGSIMIGNASREIIRMTDVETTVRIFKNVNPKT
jgi:hypothetical protein